MTTRKRLAFAKVNLVLHVGRKRSDGYHELQTVFQTIGLADRLEIQFESSASTSVELACDHPALENENNLAWRAAELLLKCVEVEARIQIRLSKQIPTGAGLGGGSSDAASVILALAELLPLRPSPEQMMKVAAELGSDVPFFLVGGTACGSGRGTQVSPLPDMPSCPLVLVTPEIEVSTDWAYQALSAQRIAALTQGAMLSTIDGFRTSLDRLATGKAEDLAGIMVNDFESIVFQRFPAIRNIRDQLLSQGALGAIMSGSGSAVFGVFTTETKADQIVENLLAEGLRAVRTVFKSRADYLNIDG